MVDREHFDEWLRQRAEAAGAERRVGIFDRVSRDADGTAIVHYDTNARNGATRVRARAIIGADGAKSKVARQCVPGADHVRYVFA